MIKLNFPIDLNHWREPKLLEIDTVFCCLWEFGQVFEVYRTFLA